jgi:hypothetical protein
VKLLLISFTALASLAQAQPGYKPPTGPAPKAADGKPDFSGLWQRPYVPDMSKNSRNGDQKGMDPLPFTEWAMEVL